MAIWDSTPWRRRLLADADLLDRWAKKPRPTERRSALIEQKVFLAAYIIRKLVEARKLSTATTDRTVVCSTFVPRSLRITLANNHKLDELYDLATRERTTVSMRALLDLIIHSLVFMEHIDEDGTVVGFYVTSSRKRYDKLWYVELRWFIALMRLVGDDYPSVVHSVFDDETDDWFVWAGHGEPPVQIQRKFDRILRRTLERRGRKQGK